MNELFEIHKNVDHSSDKWSSYFDVYEKHLKSYRGKDITLVEVGVQKGGSLDMWSEYFGSNSRIIGIDVDPKCANLVYNKKNVNVLIGNQEDPYFWDDFFKNNIEIDIFIDDGGHTMKQQIVTFEKVFPRLKLGGIFICEDTHTSYYEDFGGGLKNPATFLEYAKDFVDILHYNWKRETTLTLENKKRIVGDTLSGLYFYNSVVVFEKFGKQTMDRIIVEGKK
jgi:cephalosporin hydroxylase